MFLSKLRLVSLEYKNHLKNTEERTHNDISFTGLISWILNHSQFTCILTAFVVFMQNHNMRSKQIA